jgi:hypothetical protein
MVVQYTVMYAYTVLYCTVVILRKVPGTHICMRYAYTCTCNVHVHYVGGGAAFI